MQERKINSLRDEVLYLQGEQFSLENDYIILEEIHLKNGFMKMVSKVFSKH